MVSHGVYMSADAWLMLMFLIHLHCGQAIFFPRNGLLFDTEEEKCLMRLPKEAIDTIMFPLRNEL